MIKEESKFAASGIFEGMVSLRALFEAKRSGISDRAIFRVLYDREKADTREKAPEFAFLGHRAEEFGFALERADTAEINSMTVGNTHGGVIALCGERTFSKLETKNIATNGFYALIDGVEDPYNFGYALRSLYAAGADGIILGERNWMSAAGVAARASAGASELMPMFMAEPQNAAAHFRENGYKIICADIKNSVSVYDCDLTRPIFLIVGGEKRGISRSLLETADSVVRLDYGRDFPAALSAASAASILAFEIYRQNR